MSLAKDTFSQINKLTNSLIENSLCYDQNPPTKIPNVSGWDTCQIVIPSKEISVALKNVTYSEMYNAMNQRRNYNFRLIDGALLVLLYDFLNGNLQRHTLAYYPNPNLLSFQENEDLYFEDDTYLDMFDKRSVIVPLRFDYDGRENVYREIDHPKAHFTLGQFENCRIPVSKPLMPCQFVHFVLRNFYYQAYVKSKDKIYNDYASYSEIISENEKKLVHISV